MQGALGVGKCFDGRAWGQVVIESSGYAESFRATCPATLPLVQQVPDATRAAMATGITKRSLAMGVWLIFIGSCG